MSKFGIYFAGRDIVLPGVYALVNADAMTPARGVPSRALAIIATAQGGAVGGRTRITNLNQINGQLIGGVGAELCELAMAPSGELQGVGDIEFIRVNKAVAATLNLGDATLSAKIAGKIGNGTSGKRVTNTDGSYDLYLEHKYLGLAENYQNLGPVIKLEYVGINGVPSAAVTDDGTGVKTLTLTGDDTVALSSDSVFTIDNLIAEINSSSEWTATGYGPLIGVQFADLTAETITLTASVGYAGIGAKAFEYALVGSQIASATTTGAVANPDAGWQYFAGGNEGTVPTQQDWQDALDLAGEIDVHGVVTGTGDLAVLAAAKAHVETLSDAKNRKERLLYCGVERAASKTALFDDLETTKLGIGGKNTVIAGFEPNLVNQQTGKIETYPSYYFAAIAAGMKAGNRPETPLTNKQISVFGGSYQYSVEDLETLLEGGIMPAHFDTATGTYVITQQITSYTQDANVIYRKIAGRDIAHWLNKLIRLRLNRFIGEVGDQLTIKQILLEVTGLLTSETRNASNAVGVLTAGVNPQTGAPEPSYKNVEVVMDGFDLVAIRYEAHPVGEIAYALATAYLTPVKIVARA